MFQRMIVHRTINTFLNAMKGEKSVLNLNKGQTDKKISIIVSCPVSSIRTSGLLLRGMARCLE